MAKFLYLMFCFLIPLQLQSQTLPLERSNLNYRLVGFSVPAKDKVVEYKIEVALGFYSSADSFAKNIILTKSAEKNKIVAEVPSFGMSYTWRVVYVGANSIAPGGLHHFNTLTCPNVDTNAIRLRVTKAAKKYGDGYVFLDGNGALYDMNGRPVWFLPQIDGLKALATDMKLSPRGTITFIFKHQAYEISYGGDILWKGPEGKQFRGRSLEQFHHELTRLNNGHYMVLGIENENVLRKLPPARGDQPFIVSDDQLKNTGNDTSYQKSPFGTIVEYDAQKNVVWSWNSSTYFNSSDVYYYYRQIVSDNPDFDLHENSFFFDEKDKIIYLSFKTISRIIKIKYPEGKVLSTYGEIYQPDVPPAGNGFFYGQHSCKRSKDGHLLLYNNNMVDSSKRPKIVMMKEPVSVKDSLKIVWEFDCTMQDISRDYVHEENLFKTGGNVVELPDNSFFVSMSSPYSKVFIVNRDKEILWSALPEKWDVEQQKWTIIPQYRASIVNSRAEMEHLIWGASK